jgi:hypothetical protein
MEEAERALHCQALTTLESRQDVMLNFHSYIVF